MDECNRKQFKQQPGFILPSESIERTGPKRENSGKGGRDSLICIRLCARHCSGSMRNPHDNPRGRLSLLPSTEKEVIGPKSHRKQVIDEPGQEPRPPGSRVCAHKNFTPVAREQVTL